MQLQNLGLLVWDLNQTSQPLKPQNEQTLDPKTIKPPKPCKAPEPKTPNPQTLPTSMSSLAIRAGGEEEGLGAPGGEPAAHVWWFWVSGLGCRLRPLELIQGLFFGGGLRFAFDRISAGRKIGVDDSRRSSGVGTLGQEDQGWHHISA